MDRSPRDGKIKTTGTEQKRTGAHSKSTRLQVPFPLPSLMLAIMVVSGSSPLPLDPCSTRLGVFSGGGQSMGYNLPSPVLFLGNDVLYDR